MSAAEQRQAVADLAELAKRELFRFLAGVSPANYRAALVEVLPLLGAEYGDAAAALAADWYEELRVANGAAGRFIAVLAGTPDAGRWEALAGWASSHSEALALAAGGLQRAIADQHRLTIVNSSIADPAASGWKRVGVGDSCGWCRMLIGRGHVYTEATSTFKSHDCCNCGASPSFDPDAVKVSGEPFRQSERLLSEAAKAANRARAKAYIAEHYH